MTSWEKYSVPHRIGPLKDRRLEHLSIGSWSTLTKDCPEGLTFPSPEFVLAMLGENWLCSIREDSEEECRVC